jgi:hypothetical protein
VTYEPAASPTASSGGDSPGLAESHQADGFYLRFLQEEKAGRRAPRRRRPSGLRWRGGRGESSLVSSRRYPLGTDHLAPSYRVGVAIEPGFDAPDDGLAQPQPLRSLASSAVLQLSIFVPPAR